MERNHASLTKTCQRATLLGLVVLLSTFTWIPHMFHGLRFFFLVSIPSVASTVIARKCIFFFFNIIIVFLVGESKLSRGGNRLLSMDESNVARVGMLQGQEEDVVEVLERMVQECKEGQEDDIEVEHEGMKVEVDQCEDQDSTMVVGVEDIKEGNDTSLVVGGVEESKEVEEERAIEKEEIDEDCEELEERGLTAEELNRRVEDFIARFNMERQLEARMLVCCC